MYRLLVVIGILIFFQGCVYKTPDIDDWFEESETNQLDFRASLSSTEKQYLMGDNTQFEVTPSLPAPVWNINPEINKELSRFCGREKRFVRESIQRRSEYFPMLVEVFEQEGLPLDLINVALVESGYKTKVKSYAGAVGMWQFMKSTARVYGLKVSWSNDERKIPLLATKAAAQHLKDLYNSYGDWNLALAAYNAGSGTVDRAITKAGSRDFWVIARKGRLRNQTRRYVAKIAAVSHILQNPAKYGLYDVEDMITREKEVYVALTGSALG